MTDLGLDALQLAHAKQIVSAVHARGLPIKAAVIALETAIDESGIHVYANKWNQESLRLPNEGVRDDHGSVGIFQQQVGGAPYSTANWGSTAQCMGVESSTNSFLTALTRIDGWQDLDPWIACQEVQGSFDPTGSNYKRGDYTAHQIAAALWPTPAPMHNPVFKRADRLITGQGLRGGTQINSPSGKVHLVLQASDGNLVLYSTLRGRETATWTARTGGKRVGGLLATKFAVQSDGNLVLYTAGLRAVWSNNGRHVGDAALVVQDDGNLVMYDTGNHPIWQTKTGGK